MITGEYFKSLFVFVTGASGTGKTTVLKAMEARLNYNNVSINYFDSIGVPSIEEMIRDYGSGEKWQEIMTSNWVKKLSKITDKKLIFLEGQFNPDFIIKPLKKLNVENYLIICLDVDRDARKHRLTNLYQVPLVNKQLDNSGSEVILK